MNANILLISFYNPKSLGLRYLENALIEHGYNVKVVFFKKFNSVNPQKATDEEMALLKSLIAEFKPMAVGLSVMASLYLETVEKVNDCIKANFDIPVVWGGVYATMFPERCMGFADFVVLSEGEEVIVELADAIQKGGDYSGIRNLVYRHDGQLVVNELRDLTEDLDKYGIPVIGRDNKYLIENNALTQGDPQVKALNYEIGASRGCPFACSYCCSINLSRINKGKGRYVRFRDVDKVIEELLNAKANIKNLKVVHFWDEIFSDDEEWVDKFVDRYKKEINLPFEIWGHPLKSGEGLISKLKSAGLYKVVMGIQSGSPYIRKEIFNRPEKQEDIINASKTLAKCKVPQVVYDFMLRHPFETHDTIRETYELAMELEQPFELQMHGLNFLPGTDIVQKALDMKLVAPEEMERFMHAPLEEQYTMHWKRESGDEVMNFWYNLIYLTQFPMLRDKAQKLAAGEVNEASMKKAEQLRKTGERLTKLRYLYKKGIIVIKGTFNMGGQ